MSNEEEKLRKKKGLFAIISGILLMIIGAHGSAGSMISILITITQEGLVPLQLSFLIGQIIITIVILGGITVIIGGFLMYLRIPSLLSKTLISLGSGISVFNLYATIILISPAINPALIGAHIPTLVNIGIMYGIALLASFFALYALIDDFYGLTLGLVAGTILSIPLAINPQIAVFVFLNKIGFTNPPPILVNILTFLSFSGALFYVTGFLYSYRWYKLGFIVNLIGVIIFAIPLGIIITGIIIDAIGLFKLFFVICGLIVTIVALHYGYARR